jgi:hypothetical protein
MLNLLKRTMTYPGLEPGTFEVAVSIPNHYTIKVIYLTVHPEKLRRPIPKLFSFFFALQ